MSAEKRPASDAFGSTQMVVKRPDRGSGKAVALSNGAAGNGALIQAVCLQKNLGTFDRPLLDLKLMNEGHRYREQVDCKHL